MTPQERRLVEELFDRLRRLEAQPRDPEAERLIAEGLARAPHALYPLVQTVLVQDEALKLAEDRIRELGGEIGPSEQPRGFLDSARDTLLGPDPGRRGSVPQVRPGGAAMQPPPDHGQRGGGSFLGTAAATAAGVIGGSMLFHGLSSMLGGGKAEAGAQGFGDTARDSPWGGGARDSNLAREAGLEDIGGAREDRQGWYDTTHNSADDSGDDGGFDVGGDGGGGGEG